MIPPLNEHGLLPPGRWECTLREVESVFCGNPHRCMLWDGLRRFIDSKIMPPGASALWLDGSFTRNKPMPADIDVGIDISACNDVEAITLAAHVHIHRESIKSQYHVDVYFMHPAIPSDISAFFQYAGPKCAAERGIDARSPKGILLVQL